MWQSIVAFFAGKKTYFIVAFGVATILVQFLSGDVTFMQFLASDALQQLLELLGIATVRAGVAKALNGK